MKVIVGGCSVSDYSGTGVDRVYGEILASNIGADYVHEGAGCGSNYRIWRTITRMVMDNEIDKNDIVLVQYTDVTRQEYWSSFVFSQSYGKLSLREKKYDGDILRFKIGLSQPEKHEQKFYNLKESYFTSVEFDEERFEYNHFLFHNLMMSKNIKVAYFVPTGVMNTYSWDKKHLFNKNGEIHLTDNLCFEYPSKYLQDVGHFSQEGHECVANVIEKFIKRNKWL